MKTRSKSTSEARAKLHLVKRRVPPPTLWQRFVAAVRSLGRGAARSGGRRDVTSSQKGVRGSN